MVNLLFSVLAVGVLNGIDIFCKKGNQARQQDTRNMTYDILSTFSAEPRTAKYEHALFSTFESEKFFSNMCTCENDKKSMNSGN